MLSAVSVIKKTWESDVKHLIYFSDVADDSIPTVTLGIPNTERGLFTFTFTLSHNSDYSVSCSLL